MNNEKLKETAQKITSFLKKRWLIILFIAMLGFNVWIFGWKKVEANIYQRGVEAGKTQINNAIIQQLFTAGKLQFILPANSQGQYDLNGTSTKPIILIPQQ